MPDVLLLSEVDRGCRRTDFRNIARDFNTFFYFDDLEKQIVTVPAVKSFIDRGYVDLGQ